MSCQDHGSSLTRHSIIGNREHPIHGNSEQHAALERKEAEILTMKSSIQTALDRKDAEIAALKLKIQDIQVAGATSEACFAAVERALVWLTMQTTENVGGR